MVSVCKFKIINMLTDEYLVKFGGFHIHNSKFGLKIFAFLMNLTRKSIRERRNKLKNNKIKSV